MESYVFFKGKTSIFFWRSEERFCFCVSKCSAGQVLMVCGNFPWLWVSKIKTEICLTVDMPAPKVRSDFLPLRLLLKTRQM